MNNNNNEYFIQKLGSLIIESVDQTLNNIKGNYAVFLSGGIDSGMLAALCKPKITLTCNLPYGEKYDEYSYSKKIANFLELEQTTITVTKDCFVEHFGDAVKALGYSTAHFSLLPLYLLFKYCKDKWHQGCFNG
jgi:asparagine synthetase B (glutamine-hydrolysing)